MMLLMVLTGELAVEMKESLSVLVLAREDADDDLRNEVRMLCGEKRARMVWNREGCMVTVGGSGDFKDGVCRSECGRSSLAKDDFFPVTSE